jgi:hypothetical protein
MEGFYTVILTVIDANGDKNICMVNIELKLHTNEEDPNLDQELDEQQLEIGKIMTYVGIGFVGGIVIVLIFNGIRNKKPKT